MTKFQIALLVIAAALICIIISFYGKVSAYDTFKTATAAGREYKVIGTFDKTQPAIQSADKYQFYARDMKGEIRQVVLMAPKPQDIERSEQIVIHGHFEGAVFVCNKVNFNNIISAGNSN